MSEKPVEKNDAFSSDESRPKDGRKKKKIRIKYRQRVKLTKRPKGYKIKRFWKKNKKNLIAAIILGSLLIVVLIMVGRLFNQTVKMNQIQREQEEELLYK